MGPEYINSNDEDGIELEPGLKSATDRAWDYAERESLLKATNPDMQVSIEEITLLRQKSASVYTMKPNTNTTLLGSLREF